MLSLDRPLIALGGAHRHSATSIQATRRHVAVRNEPCAAVHACSSAASQNTLQMVFVAAFSRSWGGMTPSPVLVNRQRRWDSHRGRNRSCAGSHMPWSMPLRMP